MEEKKGETTSNKNPKKANLLDHNSIKHILDESVTEIVTSKGYPEDVRMSNIRLLMGTFIIVIALFAQFYNKKFPENRNFLIGCIALYIVFNGILQLIIYLKEKNAMLFTYPPKISDVNNKLVMMIPKLCMEYRAKSSSCRSCLHLSLSIRFDELEACPQGSFNSTGLAITSKLPRFSDMYTLIIKSADPQSISAKSSVEFTKSVTQWFTKDGVLVEGLFWKDVEKLINDYANENKKTK